MADLDFWEKVRSFCKTPETFKELRASFNENELEENGFFEDIKKWVHWANKYPDYAKLIKNGTAKMFHYSDFTHS